MTPADLVPPVADPMYVSVGLKRMKHVVAALTDATEHGNRLDETSAMRLRPGADSAANLHYQPWISTADLKDGQACDYLQAFKNMKAARGVTERGSTAPVSHMIVQFSRAWIREGGDEHDPANPRNVLAFEKARAWAEEEFGKESVLACRMDMDEAGSGVVDVLVAPEMKTKGGKRQLSISPHLRRLKAQYKRRLTFAALQDSIAEFARREIDPRLERGKEKESRGSDRLTPEMYGARKDLQRDREALERDREALAKERAAFEQERAEHGRQLKAERLALEEREGELRGLETFVDARAEEVDEQEAKWKEAKEKQQAELAGESERLSALQADLKRQKDRLGLERLEIAGLKASAKADARDEALRGAADERRQLLDAAEEDARRIKADAAEIRLQAQREAGRIEARAREKAEREAKLENAFREGIASGEIIWIDPKEKKIYFNNDLAPERKQALQQQFDAISPVLLVAGQKWLSSRRTAEENARKRGEEAGLKGADERIHAIVANVAGEFTTAFIAYFRRQLRIIPPDKERNTPAKLVPRDENDADQKRLIQSLEMAVQFGLAELLFRFQNYLLRAQRDTTKLQDKWARLLAVERRKSANMRA